MNNISLIDETLDINLTLTYHLSIQIGLNGFSYCILDSVRNKFIVLKHFPFNEDIQTVQLPGKYKDIIERDELLKKTYKSVRLIYLAQKAILVPFPLFNKENIRDFFSFNHPLTGSEAIFYNKLGNTGAYNIFTIPDELAKETNALFAKVKYYQQATPILENLMITYKNKTEQKKVFVHVNPHFFDISVIAPPSLLLYNTFLYKNEKDFIYFIMYIFEQLKLSPEKTELILSGNIEKKNAYYNILKKFIREVKFEKLNDNFTYSYTFYDIPAHCFVNLINIHTCE
ncbi:MAG: DUF3822 family protein [Bacteroidia bacterium]|nr:DUF3822 family protein [Bacteroidia bacterium]